MIVYVDIDETICESPESRDYSKAKPLVKNIKKINIVYWTARGTGSGIDWEEITTEQFKRWGVKHHEIKFGKPIYDLFIDDKNINSNSFFERTDDKIS